MAWEELAGGALGGAVVSAAVGLTVQGRERRALRAEALQAVSAAERARWASTPWGDFRKAVLDLRTAALVAGADRRLTERYVELAQVARKASESGYKMNGFAVGEDGDEYATAIASELADLVADAAQLLADGLWHPWRTGLLKPIKLRHLSKKQAAAKTALKDDRPRIVWDVHPIR